MNRYTYPNIITQYYFDTFIVGAHHSEPHLIAELMQRKLQARADSSLELECMIDKKLAELNLENLNDLESAEPAYWINELGRTAGIEINTYGRLKPETLQLLLCLEEDAFVEAMVIATRLTTRIQLLANTAATESAPVPSNMPVQS